MRELTERVRKLELQDGANNTAVSYLKVHRFSNTAVNMPETAVPYIYLVLEGSLRLHTPGGIMDYLPGQYSVSAIDTPVSGQVLTYGDKKDFLALSIEFTLDDVISVILDIDGNLAEKIINSEIDTGIMDEFDKRVEDAVFRLVQMLNKPEQLAFMGKHLRKEIIFDVLCGTCGKQFMQSVTGIQQAGEMYEINSWIKENYRGTFTVEELAKRWNMSVSNFHQKFKSAVGMGPLQCQKRLRLTEARRQMLDCNVGVTEAALDVGYESVSQFNRDYKKMFKASPREDIQRLKEQLKK